MDEEQLKERKYDLEDDKKKMEEKILIIDINIKRVEELLKK